VIIRFVWIVLRSLSHQTIVVVVLLNQTTVRTAAASWTTPVFTSRRRVIRRFSPMMSGGTPEDWLERNLYDRFPKVSISLSVLSQLGVFGVPTSPWL
jgi:hypothetical protein